MLLFKMEFPRRCGRWLTKVSAGDAKVFFWTSIDAGRNEIKYDESCVGLAAGGGWRRAWEEWMWETMVGD